MVPTNYIIQPNRKIEISKDVVVCENESWDKKNQRNGHDSTIPIQLDEVHIDDEGNTEELNETKKDTIPQGVQIQRPVRERQPPSRYADFEMLHDNEVITEGDMAHFALPTDVEPINHEDALKEDA